MVSGAVGIFRKGSSAALNQARLHAQVRVAEPGVRSRAGRMVMCHHLDVRRKIQFHIKVLGEPKPEVGIGVQVGIGNHAALAVLQRCIENVRFNLQMSGVDDTRARAFCRPIRAEWPQRIVGHGI